ncbi:MAG: hypothetical protein ABI778_04215 [Ignavibacteriota bacterium]
MIHYLSHADLGDSIMHVRIYSVEQRKAYTNIEKNTMESHWIQLLELNEITEFDDALLPVGAFSDIAVQSENEFQIGIPKFDNFTLKLEPDLIFRALMREIKTRNEIWIELVLEAKATDIPDLVAGEFFYPRKKRSIFWGKCIPNNTEGTVSAQEFEDFSRTGSPLMRKQAEHDGMLSFTFEHWLPWRGSTKVFKDEDGNVLEDANGKTVKELLDTIRAITQPIGVAIEMSRFSDILYETVKALNPTRLFAISDHTLDHFKGEDEPDALSRGNLSMTIAIKGATLVARDLYNVCYRRIDTSGLTTVWCMLFENGPNDDGENLNQFSFYNWKDLREAIVNVTQENDFIFQCELPTLEDVGVVAERIHAGRHINNLTASRRSYWGASSRWLFKQIEEVFLAPAQGIQVTPIGEVRYNPAGAFVSTVHVDEPTPDGMQIYYGFELHKANSFREVHSYFDGGQDITLKTMARFAGQDIISAVVTDVFSGVEIFVTQGTGIEYAKNVEFNLFGAKTFSLDWAEFHARGILARWGQPNTIIECDFSGTGIEAFRAGVTKHFGFTDWGEFPLLRVFQSNIGLLDEGQSSAFFLIQMSRMPGGDGKFKAIETPVFGGLVANPDFPPDVPDGPPIILPPVIHPFEPICGVVNFVFGVLWPGGCIDHADIFVDLALFGTVSSFDDPMPGSVVPVPFNIDVCTLTNGPHTISVVLHLCDGSNASALWNFTVTCPCTGGELHYFHY